MKPASTPITMDEVMRPDAPDLTNAMTVPADIISRIWSTSQNTQESCWNRGYGPQSENSSEGDGSTVE